MKTRTKKGASSKQEKEEAPASKIQQLDSSVSNPPKIFILPKDTSPDARIVTLPNPATTASNRYFVCPERGFYEFTRIAAPKRACRSWLLAPETTQDGESQADQVAEEDQGYVLQTPEMMVATPIDPLFLLLQVLAQDGQKGGMHMFLTPSDYVDVLGERSTHFKELVRIDRQSGNRLEGMLEARILAVCEEMEAGDEKLYKLSNEKLLEVLWSKAGKMVERGLPPSMEERFVKQALVVPVMSVKREESSISAATDGDIEDATSGASQSETASAGTSQDTPNSTTTTATSIRTTAASRTSLDSHSPTDSSISHLLRLRTAFTYLLSSYIPSTLRSTLTTFSFSIDFAPLDSHLTHVAKLKSEAQALRSMSENISRKRGIEDDEEALEKAEAKKRKKEEEEFKKKNMSRGVKQLGKADTSGMKKMSAFFGKAAVKK